MKWKRHTLVDISNAGRKAILADIAVGGCGQAATMEQVAQVLLPERAGARIPGIIRRVDGVSSTESVPVGFCGPFSGPGGRLRIAAMVRHEEVVRSTSPYELMATPISGRTASLQALIAAERLAGRLGLRLGVWGSAALEIYTGLPYTHQDSDLDLLVAPTSQGYLTRFLDEIQAMEKNFVLRIDVELDLPNGYGVQLKEFLGGGRMVLGKSFSDVALLSREKVLSHLPDAEGPAGSAFA